MLITTEQAKEHLKINATMNDSSFEPFIPDAEEKYIKPFLGDDLFEMLQTWQETEDDVTSPELAALYPYVVAALSRFTMLLASPHLNLNIGDQGFGVTSTANVAPASKERVADFKASLETLAWGNIEKMLRFLEENQTDYPEWIASEAYTMATRNLINSAYEFNKYVDIDRSRLTFHSLRKAMDNIEEIDVKNLISAEQFDDLLEKLRDGDELEAEESVLLAHLRAFIANKVASTQLGKNTLDVAMYHYNAARVYINANIEVFTLFADSDCYDEAEAPLSDFDNSEDYSFFMT
jgi:hypothetical protein